MGNGTRSTPEFRRQAVRLSLTSGPTRREIAEGPSVGLSTLTRWPPPSPPAAAAERGRAHWRDCKAPHARSEPRQPLANSAQRDAERLGHLPRALPGPNAGDNLLSTVDGQAGTMMRVVHPSGSSAGVWRLQPDLKPGEQPPETSHLEEILPGRTRPEAVDVPSAAAPRNYVEGACTARASAHDTSTMSGRRTGP